MEEAVNDALGLEAGQENASELGEESGQQAAGCRDGLQGQARELSRLSLEEGSGRLNGEETPSASSPFQLHQHLSFPSWSQPLPGPPQPFCWLPSVPQAWMELPGGCARMMEILGYFKPLRDLTKFLKSFLPKVLFFCKTLFVGTLTSFFKYYHYVIVVF